MTTETYRELCEAANVISAVSRRSANQWFLFEWRQWARVLVSGLYCSKTALRAAESALVEADEFVLTHPLLSRVARAAALTATGVVHAANNDDTVARSRAAAAKKLIGGVDLERASDDVVSEHTDPFFLPESARPRHRHL